MYFYTVRALSQKLLHITLKVVGKINLAVKYITGEIFFFFHIVFPFSVTSLHLSGLSHFSIDGLLNI